MNNVDIIYKNLLRPVVVIRNLFTGMGLYHSIYTEKDYYQIPLPILFPSIYIGYHSYKYSDKIKNYILNKE